MKKFDDVGNIVYLCTLKMKNVDIYTQLLKY